MDFYEIFVFENELNIFVEQSMRWLFEKDLGLRIN